MAGKTFGYRPNVPSEIGEKFMVGSEVAFLYKEESQVGVIETMLNNSAVVRIVLSPTKTLHDFTTVIRYADMQDTKNN
ncbi:hypothetical protein [Enterococcus sp. AZ109]|uniref:hypothetical protein n=1 Tax=Enterococcus sp. AZ109 TaxID=2774634 RepID=UPI003F2282D7